MYFTRQACLLLLQRHAPPHLEDHIDAISGRPGAQHGLKKSACELCRRRIDEKGSISGSREWKAKTS